MTFRPPRRAFLHASASTAVLADIQKTGVVRIAIPQDFPSSGAPGTDLTPQGVH